MSNKAKWMIAISAVVFGCSMAWLSHASIDETSTDFIDQTSRVNQLSASDINSKKQAMLQKFTETKSARDTACQKYADITNLLNSKASKHKSATALAKAAEAQASCANAEARYQAAIVSKRKGYRRFLRQAFEKFKQRKQSRATRLSTATTKLGELNTDLSTVTGYNTSAASSMDLSAIDTYKSQCNARKAQALAALNSVKAELAALSSSTLPFPDTDIMAAQITNSSDRVALLAKLNDIKTQVAAQKTTLQTDETTAQARYDAIVAKCAGIESRESNIQQDSSDWAISGSRARVVSGSEVLLTTSQTSVQGAVTRPIDLSKSFQLTFKAFFGHRDGYTMGDGINVDLLKANYSSATLPAASELLLIMHLDPGSFNSSRIRLLPGANDTGNRRDLTKAAFMSSSGTNWTNVVVNWDAANKRFSYTFTPLSGSAVSHSIDLGTIGSGYSLSIRGYCGAHYSEFRIKDVKLNGQSATYTGGSSLPAEGAVITTNSDGNNQGYNLQNISGNESNESTYTNSVAQTTVLTVGSSKANGIRLTTSATLLRDNGKAAPSQLFKISKTIVPITAGKGNWYKIYSPSSYLSSTACVDRNSNGNVVAFYTCSTHKNQEWQFLHVPSTSPKEYLVLNRATGLCMQADQQKVNDGATSLATCSISNAKQHWKLVPVSDTSSSLGLGSTANPYQVGTTSATGNDLYELNPAGGGKGAIWMNVNTNNDITLVGKVKFVGSNFVADGVGVGIQCDSPTGIGRGAGWVGLAGNDTPTTTSTYRGYGFMIQTWSGNNAIRVATGTDASTPTNAVYPVSEPDLRGTFSPNQWIDTTFKWQPEQSNLATLTFGGHTYTYNLNSVPKSANCYVGFTSATGGAAQAQQVQVTSLTEETPPAPTPENINSYVAFRNKTHNTRVINYAHSALSYPYIAGYGSHPHQIWQIVTTGSGSSRYSVFKNLETPTRCMSASSSAVNAVVEAQNCGSSNNDRWQIFQISTSGDTTYYQVKNVAQGTCMYMRTGYTASAQRIYMNTCNSSDSEQLWSLPTRRYGNSTSFASGNYIITNKAHSSLVLTMSDGNQFSTGTRPIITTYDSSIYDVNQRWKLTQSGTYNSTRIASAGSGYTLNLQSGFMQTGSNILPNMWSPVVHPDQLWTIEPVYKADGQPQYYLIANDAKQTCLNAASGSSGDTVSMTECSALADPAGSSAAASQLWTITAAPAPSHPAVTLGYINSTNKATLASGTPNKYTIQGKSAVWMPVDTTKRIEFSGNVRFVGNSFVADGFGIGIQCYGTSGIGRGAGWVGLGGNYGDSYRGYGFMLQSWSSSNAIRLARGIDYDSPTNSGYPVQQSNFRGTFSPNKYLPFVFIWDPTTNRVSLKLDGIQYSPTNAVNIPERATNAAEPCYIGVTAGVGGYSQLHETVLGNVTTSTP